MKFGLFYELSVPRPWTRESERTVYDNALEQVKLADELGFDQVWAVEHHFLEEYSHCPAPELFLTACAMVTKRIRVGFGIVVCVPEFNHPIKIAERTAVLDILSGGRVEVGTGRSATWTELAGFNASPDVTKKSWDEFVRCLPRMWTSEKFEFEGEFWSMPRRTILPKVYQRPHPPMWVAVTSPGTELDAADRGLGSLGLTFGQFAEQEKRIAEYRRRIQLCEPVGEFVNDQVSTVNFLYCHEDDADRAQDRTADGEPLQLPRRAAHLGARDLSVQVVPVARAAAAAAPSGDRTRGVRAGGRGAVSRRSGAHHARAPALGSVRCRPRQFPDQHRGDDSAGRRAGEPPALRARSHARVQREQVLMPIFGELELGTIAGELPRLRDLDTEAWELPKAEILQLACEIADGSRALLPRALHPAIPEYVTFVVTRYPESPVGPFDLAQVRLMARAGVHPRGYVVGAVASTASAASELRERWGYPAAPGEITLRRYHDRVAATVRREGQTILEMALIDPEIVSGGDLQYIHGITLARVDGATQLVQVDPHYTLHNAARGRAHVSRFEAAAWNAERRSR